MFEPIAIVGRACLLPGAHTPGELWKLVMERRVAIGPVPEGRWRAGKARMLSSGACATDVGGVVSGFERIWDPSQFPVDAQVLADLDPVVHWLLHTGREALLDAGIADPARTRIGVVAGNLAYPTEALVDFAQSVYLPDAGTKQRGPLNRFSSGFPVHLMCSALGLNAGGYAIDAACASSLYAIKLASDWLHSGRADAMLAGAVNRCDGLMIHAGFTALRALSPSGQSRPFHRDADGLIPAEGAAFIVLKRLADAVDAGDRILAVIRGIGLSNDGRDTGILTPSSEGQVRAMKAAYADSGLTPADISLVECHATGTTVGDAIELRSMASVFAGVRDVPIASLKSNIGHAITASGAAGIVRVIEAMKAGVRPATAGSGPLTDALSGTPMRVLREAEPWRVDGVRGAAISSFGFGGNNAHLVMEEYLPGVRYHAANPTRPRARVAVVALAAQAGDGRGTEDFISDLLFGQRAVGERARDIRIPAAGLVFPPRDLSRALAQQTILLSVAGNAISQTTIPNPERTCVLMGIQCDGEATRPVIRLALADIMAPNADLEAAMDEPMDAPRVIGCMPNIPANRINRQFSIGGPGFSVAAEELSGIRALEIAIEELQTGRTETAVVGASDLCAEPVHSAATRERPGDAACVMVLKRADDAVRDGDRILALVEPGDGDNSGLSARVRECFGTAHAASGLLNVAAAVAAINHAALPGGVPFLPGEEPRSLNIRTEATGGQSASIRVSEGETERHGCTAGDVPDIFLYSGRDLTELGLALGGNCRLAIVATEQELAGRIAQAIRFLNDAPETAPPDGIFFQPEKIEGQLAFVFTGAAAAYPGMGRDLLLAMPELAQNVGEERGLDVRRYAGWIYNGADSPSDFEQLCGSSFLCQIHAGLTLGVLGLKPDAAIGLSSGETNALFALGAWHGMGTFLREIEDCELYTRVLGGHAEALDGRRWANYRVSASMSEVHNAIAGQPDVFLTIVNSSDDVLIGGESTACERVVRQLGSHRCVRLPMEFAVHCPAVQPASELWRRLHTRETARPAGTRFYSNARGASYDLTSESIGDALTQQALETVDFPRTIRTAWDNGVRIFVEHGPRNQCSQSIRAILGDRPHLAISLDIGNRSSLRQALHASAELWCAGVEVDIAGLRGRLNRLRPPARETQEMLTFAAHPAPPLVPSDDEVFVMAPAPQLAPLLATLAQPQVARPVHHTISAMHAVMSEAHQLHVAEITRTQDAFLTSQRHLLALLGTNGHPPQKAEPRRATRAFSRLDLEKLASGRISDVFGEAFRGQDGYARQVRMPEPPLLLADRVIDLTGEPNSMGLGSIITETHIAPGAWYLHQGYMPAGFAVESGQADLLLISWLGVDRFNQGQRVYRLLGCELTFHGSLPRTGETLRYEIHVDGHASHGDIRMFFFHYDCRVDGKPRLTVRQGQAGFFSDEELANSEGVLWSAESATPTPETSTRVDAALRAAQPRAFDAAQIRAFSEGRVADCFGETFARAFTHTRSPRIQNGRMLLLQTVPVFDPNGGPWKRGYLRAESIVSPDDWFFEGHFKNDPCMPGTLMFEGCLQAMAFYMSGLGFSLDRDGWRFEPVPDVAYSLRCRGQVLPSSKFLAYEVFVDEIVDGPEPTLYADVLCTVDGLKAFHCRRLGLRLVPDWPLGEVRTERSAAVPFDQESLMACALGRPSNAFGANFVRFDGPIRVPRLPGPPYHFMSRVTRTEPGNPVAGAVAEVEYDVPANAWYFAENGNPVMPISVLTEVLLQPCGWLASYAGTWLDVKHDIFFRNLDGGGVFHIEVGPNSGVLRTRVTLTSCSPVGAMSITAFRILSHAGDQLLFEGTAVFGHFPAEALKNQAGLLPAGDELQWLAEPCTAPMAVDDVRHSELLGRDKLRMIDRIAAYWPEGGVAKLGVLRAEKDIDPRQWFFKAHFFSDPVQPGSLGIEAVVQTLQAYMLLSAYDAGMRKPRFEPVAMGLPVSWTYRGQVLPHNRLMTVLLEVLEVARDHRGVCARAAASLWVDGTKIYSLPECGMRLVDSADTPDIELLDSTNDGWLRDHCPTYTVPVLPMMSVLDRLAGAAGRSAPHRRVIEIRNVRLNGWIPIGSEARRLKTHTVEKSAERLDVTLSVWRDAPHKEMSRYDAMASAEVQLSDNYPVPPPPMTPLTGTTLEHDPPMLDIYEAGELFHGPQFHFLTKLWRSKTGSSFVLDAGADAVPRGFLDQALFDGIAHGIPNENLRLWSDRIPADQVGYPSRITRLSLFADCPGDRRTGCEVRFAGFFENQERFPRFVAQLVRDGQVWAEMELVYALFPKGPLGLAPGRQRRMFLQDKRYVPELIVGTCQDGLTRVSAAELHESDWLPGTIDTAFGIPTGIPAGDRLFVLAIKQHIARKTAVHPAVIDVAEDFRSARCAQFPMNIFPVSAERTDDAVMVRDEPPARLQCEVVRQVWKDLSGVGDWPIADLHIALIERFVRRVELRDPEGFAALRGKPVIYLANHQVAVESILANVLLSALSEVPIKVIAKTEHRQSWIGRLIDFARRYPGARQPEPILFFDRSDAASFFALLKNFKEDLERGACSLMAHVEGTRATSSRTRVSQVSATLPDLALELNLPVVPICFIGGLPVNPVAARLEFPFENGQQDICVGSAIAPATLRELSLAERSRLIVNAMNALAPEDGTPLPPDLRYAAAGPNVLVESLRLASHRGKESALLLSAVEVEGGHTPWIEEFAAFLRDIRI